MGAAGGGERGSGLGMGGDGWSWERLAAVALREGEGSWGRRGRDGFVGAAAFREGEGSSFSSIKYIRFFYFSFSFIKYMTN
jgi:hypothetical protein